MNSYTVTKKLQVIKWHKENGSVTRETARHFGLSRRVIGEWLKNEKTLRANYIAGKKDCCRFTTGKRPMSSELDERLFKYLQEQRQNGVAVTNKMLSVEALKIAKSLKIKDFKASSMFIYRWKGRFKLATKKRKKVLAESPDDESETSEKEDDASSNVWNSLMTLHPIGSEASTSGFSFSATSSSDVSKSETRSILQSEKALSPSLTPNVPTEEGVPSSLCIVKMEIEDDGYNDIPAEESFIANLASSRQDNTPNNLTASVLPFIKTEISEEILPTIPELSTNAKPESISNKQSVEEFFKSVAQTVMQLPPYLIEETKIKVSSLVKEMTMRAVNEELQDSDFSDGSNEEDSRKAEENSSTDEGFEITETNESSGGRRKRRPGVKGMNMHKINKILRLEGKEYIGRRNTTVNIPKEARRLKPRCDCKGKSFHCLEFSEDRRKEIFEGFWSIRSWEERGVFVRRLVKTKGVKVRKTKAEDSRRSMSYYYYMELETGEPIVQVCKKFFLNTLCLGEWSMRNWVAPKNLTETESELSNC